jgi:hypothetical protein
LRTANRSEIPRQETDLVAVAVVVGDAGEAVDRKGNKSQRIAPQAMTLLLPMFSINPLTLAKLRWTSAGRTRAATATRLRTWRIPTNRRHARGTRKKWVSHGDVVGGEAVDGVVAAKDQKHPSVRLPNETKRSPLQPLAGSKTRSTTPMTTT